MNYWIGVISSKIVYENIGNGSHNWFCLSRQCNVGDEFFLFATSKVLKNGGVFGRFEILNIDKNRNNECRIYGGSNSDFAEPTVFTEFRCIELYSNVISTSKIKSNLVLRNNQAVRRSFRGTCFNMSDKEYFSLLSLAKK